jgi:hypothetical protein
LNSRLNFIVHSPLEVEGLHPYRRHLLLVVLFTSIRKRHVSQQNQRVLPPGV